MGITCAIHVQYSRKIKWSQGGQYGEFRAATLRFIDCLLASGISPIFVFDGIIDNGIGDKQQKVGTKLDSHTKSICDIRDYLIGNIARHRIDCILSRRDHTNTITCAFVHSIFA